MSHNYITRATKRIFKPKPWLRLLRKHQEFKAMSPRSTKRWTWEHSMKLNNSKLGRLTKPTSNHKVQRILIDQMRWQTGLKINLCKHHKQNKWLRWTIAKSQPSPIQEVTVPESNQYNKTVSSLIPVQDITTRPPILNRDRLMKTCHPTMWCQISSQS